MKVLVTGWAGYLGPHVVRLLRERGHYVIGLDTGWFLHTYQEKPVYPHESIWMDLRDAWLDDFDVDVIVHLAGLSNDPMSNLDPELTRDINFTGTANLIGTNDDRRHVIASSCSVYGTADLATEETAPAPLTAYATAKANVDRFVADMDEAVSLRFGTLYGWSPGYRLDLVVNRMVRDALFSGIKVYGNAARPLLNVEDAASAIVYAAVEQTALGGVYNVTGENWRMQDLGKTVQAAVKKYLGATPSLTFLPSSGDARDYSVLDTKLRASGWQPTRTIEDTLPGLIERSFVLRTPSLLTRLSALESLKLDKRLRSAA